MQTPRTVLALLAAVLCLAAAPHPARAAPSASDQVEAALARMVRSMDPDQRLIVDSVGLLNLTLKGTSEVLNGRPPPADWKTQVAQARASVAAQRAALPPFQTTDLGVLADTPRMARALPLLARLPQTTGDAADAILATVDEIMPLMEAAQAGDQRALDRLPLVVLRGLESNLLAQDALLDLTIAVAGDSHPQTALAQAVKASHAAQRQMISFRIASLSGAAVDPAATLAAIRQELADCRAAAARVRPLARTVSAEIAGSELDPQARDRFVAAFATYGDSADVEIAIADLIERNLEDFIQGVTSEDQAQAFDRDLQALSDRRMALQYRRQDSLRQ